MKSGKRVPVQRVEIRKPELDPPAEMEAVARPRLRLALSWRESRAVDRLLLGALALMTLLTVAFHRGIEDWQVLAATNIAVGTLFVLFVSSSRLWSEKNVAFAIRMVGFILMMAYVDTAVEKLQLILYGHWLDASVIGLEKVVFGGQPTLWLQRFTTPGLTEWLMFAYVAYLPLYPATAVLLQVKRGDAAVERLFFTLALTNVVCDFAFILFPVAGPLFHMGGQYTVPLQGYFWTRLGEGMRVGLQFMGGTIPSPHCACTTVMWLMTYRYYRPVFWVLSPLILSLYVSTFYCRYHYLTDSIVGIVVGALAFALAPFLMKRWASPADKAI